MKVWNHSTKQNLGYISPKGPKGLHIDVKLEEKECWGRYIAMTKESGMKSGIKWTRLTQIKR